MRAVVFIMTLGALAACGADGEPQRPMPGPSRPGVTIDASTATGITISGNARVGFTN